MRTELDKIGIIVTYLNGEMTATEKQQFEVGLAANPETRNDLQNIELLLKSFEKLSIQADIKKARAQYSTLNKIKLAIFVVAVIATITILIAKNWTNIHHYYNSYSQDTELSEKSQEGIFNTEFLEKPQESIFNVDAIKKQSFIIDNTVTNIIETEAGIVIAMEPYSFGSNGKEIKIEVQEAIKPSDIIKAGLSTTYENSLLETSGMFNIQAFDKEELVPLLKDFIVEVPLLDGQSDYQLFDGKVNSDGSISWTNPQPLENYLQTYYVPSLNFYPPNYEAGLEILGKNRLTKSEKDSIYFNSKNISKAVAYRPPLEVNPFETNEVFSVGNNSQTQTAYDSAFPEKNEITKSIGDCLNPSQVRAIWDSNFNNTIFATKEFEERLHYLHLTTGSGTKLDDAIAHMPEDLKTLDACLMSECSYEYFNKLKTRKEGRIRPNQGIHKELSKYYIQKIGEYEKSVQANIEKLHNAHREGLSQIQQNLIGLLQSEGRDNQKNYNYEYSLTLKNAYKDLGLEKNNNPVPAITSYRKRSTAVVRSLGWKNIDRIVNEAIINRESFTFTDKKTNKSTSVNFIPLEISCEGWTFENAAIYLMPDQLDSYIKVPIQNGKASYKLNELISYTMIFVGFKNNQSFYQEVQKIPPGNFIITAALSTEAEVKAQLNKNYKGSVIEENQVLKFLLHCLEKEKFNNSKINQDYQLEQQIRPYIFNCNCGQSNDK